MTTETKRTALVIGATGLVGKHLVSNLLEDSRFNKVITFSRSSTNISNPKHIEHIVDFEHVENWKGEVRGDVMFSALGTTIKKAGGKTAQYKIDFTYQYEVAKAAADNQVNCYVLVSSLGANPKSALFYPRMKGELDEAVRSLTFENINIVRPSALIGKRDEVRKGEKAMITVSGFLVKYLPFLKKYQPLDANLVARAMINISFIEDKVKYKVFNNDVLFGMTGN